MCLGSPHATPTLHALHQTDAHRVNRCKAYACCMHACYATQQHLPLSAWAPGHIWGAPQIKRALLMGGGGGWGPCGLHALRCGYFTQCLRSFALRVRWYCALGPAVVADSGCSPQISHQCPLYPPACSSRHSIGLISGHYQDVCEPV